MSWTLFDYDPVDSKTTKLLKEKKNKLSDQRVRAFIEVAEKDRELFELRKKWHIPDKGLAEVKGLYSWCTEHVKTDYTTQVINYNDHDGYDSSYIKYTGKKNKKYDHWRGTYLIKREFQTQVIKLMTKYGLPRIYFDAIFGYIIFDKVLFSVTEHASIISTRNKLFIEIYSETTTKDIQAIWKQVEEKQDSLQGLKRTRIKAADKNYKRDAQIFRLKRVLMKSNPEIVRILEEKKYSPIPKVNKIGNIVKSFEARYVTPDSL